MIIGILGAGRMGLALAQAITAAGDQVLLVKGRQRRCLGRIPASPAPLAELRQRASTVLLALPFPVALELMSGPAGQIGAGRTLIDVTNPAFATGVTLPPGRSGGELIAEAASTWQVVKAFNAVPAEEVAARYLYDRPVSVPVAGAPPAKTDAFALARRLGFEPLDAGGIGASRELEALALLLSRISTAHGLHGRIAIHIGSRCTPARAS